MSGELIAKVGRKFKELRESARVLGGRRSVFHKGAKIVESLAAANAGSTGVCWLDGYIVTDFEASHVF